MFFEILIKAGMNEFALPEVFRIFDINGDGSISMKEFLLTLLALRPPENEEEEEEASRLYFNIFDVDKNGTIDKNELQVVLTCIFNEGSSRKVQEKQSAKSADDISGRYIYLELLLCKLNYCCILVSNIDDLYRTIDENGDGIIDFSEFQRFYEAVIQLTANQNAVVLHNLT